MTADQVLVISCYRPDILQIFAQLVCILSIIYKIIGGVPPQELPVINTRLEGKDLGNAFGVPSLSHGPMLA